MNYQQLKAKHRKSIDNFPIRFAFSQKQLDEIKAEWNVENKDLISIGAGGIVREKDGEAFTELFIANALELSEAMKDDDFLVEAFEYELGNHEYIITYDTGPTLEALGFDPGKLTDREKDCLSKAREQYLEWQNLYG